MGRYLIRHCAAMVFGFCNFRPDPDSVNHKQLAVLDYYFGDRGTRRLQTVRHRQHPADLDAARTQLMKAHMSGVLGAGAAQRASFST